jgi:hypothetical protein
LKSAQANGIEGGTRLTLILYLVSVVLVVGGAYFLLAAYQSASFSVGANPIMSEIYKTRSMAFFPIALLMFIVALLSGVLARFTRQS